MKILLTQIHYFSSICILKLAKDLVEYPSFIYGCSSMAKGMANGSMLVDKYFVSPPLEEEERYLDFIIHICNSENIDLLISSDEDELKILKKNEELFTCSMIIPSLKILNLFTDKYNASIALEQIGIKTPKIYTDLCSVDTMQNSKFIFRQKKSTGSKGVFVQDLNEKYIENHFNKNNFIQEFIGGKEYTVDVLCDKSGIIKLAIPRERLDIRNGITYKCRVVYQEAIINACLKIYKNFCIPGFSNLQFKLHNDVPFFIELNPRFAGTGIASSLASFNVLRPFIEHFILNKPMKTFEFYMNTVAWNSVITRFYEESLFIPK